MQLDLTVRELYALDLCLNAANNAEAWAGEQESKDLAVAIFTAARKIRAAKEANVRYG